MTITLNGKKGVVTGGTTGIGFAAAEAMIANGAQVIVTGRNQGRLDDAVARLGPKATGVIAPAQDPDAPGAIADAVRARFGRIDFAFLNAGVSGPAPLGSIDAAAAAEQLQVNVIAPLMTAQALAALFNEGASVFLTTSNLDRLGMPGMAVYSASKAAVRSITRTLAAELKDQGVRVNSLAPGPVQTPIYGKLGLTEEQLAGMAEGVRAQVPLGRFADPAEIAGAAVFLASDASSFMLGEEITIDGGWSAL